jgi:hypothetical protein
MATVVFVHPDGRRTEARAAAGASVMQIAVDAASTRSSASAAAT